VPEGAITSAPGAIAAAAPSEAAPAPVAAAAAAAPVAPAAPAGAITFDDLPNPNHPYSGQYPSGVIDWGTDAWYLSGPFGAFTNQSVGFNGPGKSSASFVLVAPRKLVSIDAYNGGAPTTITLSCDGNPDVTTQLASNQLATIQTNWTAACSKVTVTSTNGWDTNFKNLVLSE